METISDSKDLQLEDIDDPNQRIEKIILVKAAAKVDMEKVLHLVDEMTDQEKRLFARGLDLNIRYTANSFPDLLFRKEIRQLGKAGLIGRKILYRTISILIDDIFEQHDYNFEQLIGQRDEQIANFGLWHYYWAIDLHPFQSQFEELHLAELREIVIRSESAVEALPHDTAVEESVPEVSKNKPVTSPNPLEELLKNEKAKRIELEQTLAKQLRDHHQLEKKANKKSLDYDQLQKKFSEMEQKYKQLTAAHKEIEKAQKKELADLKNTQGKTLQSNKKELNALLQEREALVAEIVHWKGQVSSLKQQKNELEEANTALQHEVLRLTQSCTQLQQEVVDLQNQFSTIPVKPVGVEQTPSFHGWLTTVTGNINKEIAYLSADVLTQSLSIEEKRNTRDQIRCLLDITDQLDTYMDQYPDHVKEVAPVSNETQVKFELEDREAPSEIRVESLKPANSYGPDSNLTEFLEVLQKEEVNGIPGTFYRNDWGGVIQLESGDSITLKEDDVLEQDLRHGAGIRYKGMDIGKHQISVVMQGDDQEAAIDQYFGYISLGDHHKWYCVDATDTDTRFLIDGRDLSRIPKKNLTPCFFNVSKGGMTARISKIYTDDFPQMKKGKGKKPSKNKMKGTAEIRASKSEVEPYLTGCKVAIVGGLRKWFEEIVQETGAELIHNDGSTPHRVYPELGRANALILHIESNSHNASWGSVEVAKDVNIPIYKITGSKTSLKNLLWEKREEIIERRRA